MSTKLEITKAVTRLVVGVSTSFTVANALRANLHTDSKLQKAEIYVGSVAMGAVAAEAAGKYTDNFIDEIAKAFNTARQAAEDAS